MRFSKGVVITCFISLHVFTAIYFFYAWYGKFMPDVIVERFFTVIGVEFGALALIAVIKAIFNKSREDLKDGSDGNFNPGD